jgi:hypothetical protein
MKRIKYISRHGGGLDQREIDRLVSRAARKNEQLEITGIFMSSGELFFQLIEGPAAHVDELFERILGDPRHLDVLVLEEETGVEERFFPSWSMHKVDLEGGASERLEPVREMLRRVIERRREVEDLTRTIERAIWHELATAIEG